LGSVVFAGCFALRLAAVLRGVLRGLRVERFCAISDASFGRGAPALCYAPQPAGIGEDATVVPLQIPAVRVLMRGLGEQPIKVVGYRMNPVMVGRRLLGLVERVKDRSAVANQVLALPQPDLAVADMARHSLPPIFDRDAAARCRALPELRLFASPSPAVIEPLRCRAP
jgi:hypothetical protein